MKKTAALLGALFTGFFALTALAGEDLVDRGARLAAERCATCHGADGRGINGEYPSLAGQHSDYIVKQIFNIKTGQRINEVMRPVVDQLMAVEIRALAAYYATQQAGSTAASNLEQLATGRQLYFRGNTASSISACVSCHGVYATGGAQMPRLAGQNPGYLKKQLRSFINHTRSNDRFMHLSLVAMTENEVQAVATYLANEE